MKNLKPVRPKKSLCNYSAGHLNNGNYYFQILKCECYADVEPDDICDDSYIFIGKSDLDAFIKTCNATLHYLDRTPDRVPDHFKFWCNVCGKEGRINQYQCDCGYPKRASTSEFMIEYLIYGGCFICFFGIGLIGCIMGLWG